MSDSAENAAAGHILAMHARFERQDAINRGFAEVLAGFAAVLIKNTGVPSKLFQDELERIATAWQGLGISPEAPDMLRQRLRVRLAAPPAAGQA